MEDKHIIEPNAMTLSTISSQNCPKARVVLLKKFDSDGFTFFTNYNSTKGKSIQNNNNVCLNFYWPSLEKQIIVIGNANRIPQKNRMTILIQDHTEVKSELLYPIKAKLLIIGNF